MKAIKALDPRGLRREVCVEQEVLEQMPAPETDELVDRTRLLRAVRCLGRKGHREIVLMRLAGEAWEGIAREMNLKPDTVRRYWHEAVKELRELLSRED